MLAVRAGIKQHLPIKPRSPLCKTSLRRTCTQPLAAPQLAKRPGEPVDGVSFWQASVPLSLEGADLPDAAYVPLVTTKRLRDEYVHQVKAVIQLVLAETDRDDVGVVVLTSQAGGVLVPHEGGAHAFNLVGGDLLTVAGSADHYAQATGIGNHTLTALDAEGRVVVQSVVLVGAVVDDLMPSGTEAVGQGVLELESCVVCGNVDAHGLIVPYGYGDTQLASVSVCP